MSIFRKFSQLWRKQFEQETTFLSGNDSTFGMPLERIFERATENLETQLVCQLENACGDSPIEKILWLALKMEIAVGLHEHTQLLTMPRGVKFDQANYPPSPDIILVVEPQLEFEDWRVDFVVHTAGYPARLIVECDGHEFHERTKKQAERDRSRDRAYQLRGYTVLRFTGSEIWRNPCACVEQILDWATRNEPFK